METVLFLLFYLNCSPFEEFTLCFKGIESARFIVKINTNELDLRCSIATAKKGYRFYISTLLQASTDCFLQRQRYRF
jgi:hypothetical protein